MFFSQILSELCSDLFNGTIFRFGHLPKYVDDEECLEYNENDENVRSQPELE